MRLSIAVVALVNSFTVATTSSTSSTTSRHDKEEGGHDETQQDVVVVVGGRENQHQMQRYRQRRQNGQRSATRRRRRRRTVVHRDNDDVDDHHHETQEHFHGVGVRTETFGTKAQLSQQLLHTPLRNHIVVTSSDVDNDNGWVECDPNNVDDDNNDVVANVIGVLACGQGQYCMESTESTLGGVCFNDINNNNNKYNEILLETLINDNNQHQRKLRRRLQVVGNQTALELAIALCNTTDFAANYTCVCDLDYEASSGTFNCVGAERCGNLFTGCSDYESFQYCLSGTIEGNLISPTNYSYTTCYKQTMPAASYVFEYCTDFSYDTTNGPQCDIQVAGIPCKMCSINIGGGSSYGENCEVFDCTNTLIGYAGDRCGVFANPTLLIESEINYLYQEQWPCKEGCNLCGPGGYMTNGKNTFNYTPPFLAPSTTFKCYDIMYGALVGGLTDTAYCETLPPLAAEPCGCVGGGNSSDPPVDNPAKSPTLLSSLPPTIASPPSGSPPDGTEPGGASSASAAATAAVTTTVLAAAVSVATVAISGL